MAEGTHGYLEGVGGIRLFFRAFEVGESRGRVLVLHGIGEHSGRYGRLASVVNAAGFDVYALDLRGHGRSQGRRGHVRSFDHYLRDLDRLRRRIGQERPRGPTVVFGHSLGGLIAGRYVQEFGFPELRGAVLVAPFLDLAMAVPEWKRRAGGMADRLLPTLTLDNGLRDEDLFRTEPEREAYGSDPLVHRRISARLWSEMRRNARQFERKAGQVRTPLLLQLPGDDRVVSAAASRRVAKSFGGACEVREYPEAFHALYHDPVADRSLADLSEWLEGRGHEIAGGLPK